MKKILATILTFLLAASAGAQCPCGPSILISGASGGGSGDVSFCAGEEALCADGECLTWDDATSCFTCDPCAAAGNSVLVEENNVAVGAATTLDYLGADFDIVFAAGEADIVIAAALARDSELPLTFTTWTPTSGDPIVADTTSDSATLTATAPLTATGTAASDTITIACATCVTDAGNAFVTFDASSGTDPVADTTTDTITVTGTAPVTVTGDAATDTLTIACATCDTTADLWTDGTNGYFSNTEMIVVGADAAESIADTGFTGGAGSLFVSGQIGVEGLFFTDTGLVVLNDGANTNGVAITVSGMEVNGSGNPWGITANTSGAGAHTQALAFAGGGTISSSTGAYLVANGIDDLTAAGDFEINTGDVSGGDVVINLSNTTAAALRVNAAEAGVDTLVFNAASGLALTGDSDNGLTLGADMFLRITETTGGGGTHYTSFVSPALAANVAYTLPVDDGTAGQQLQTDGAGVLSWEAAGGGVAFSAITGSTNTTAAMVVGSGASLRSAAGIFGIPSGTTPPATCTVGDVFQDTDADTDGTVLHCNTTNNWKDIDDDGAGGGDLWEAGVTVAGAVYENDGVVIVGADAAEAIIDPTYTDSATDLRVDGEAAFEGRVYMDTGWTIGNDANGTSGVQASTTSLLGPDANWLVGLNVDVPNETHGLTLTADSTGTATSSAQIQIFGAADEGTPGQLFFIDATDDASHIIDPGVPFAEFQSAGGRDVFLNTNVSLVMEGDTADANEGLLTPVAGLTGDRTWTLPDATGEVSVLGQTIETGEAHADFIIVSDIDTVGEINTLAADDDFVTLTGAQTISGEKIITGVEVDFEAGAANSWPRLLNETTPTAGDCDAAGESGRLLFDPDLDTNGSVMVCLGTGGWKDIDDDGGAGGGNSFETIDAPAGTDPVAESATDTLVITATAPAVVTGTAGTDTLAFTIAGTTAEFNTALSDANFATLSFTTANASSGTDPVADSESDTLNVTGTSPIIVTGDSGTDTLTIAWDATVGKPPREVCFDAANLQVIDGAVAELEEFDGTNLDFYTRRFDDTAVESGGGKIRVPNDLNSSGTVTFRISGSAVTAAASVFVEFTFNELERSDSEAQDAAYGTVVSGDLDTDDTQGDVDLFSWTETVSNLGWTAGDIVFFRLDRTAPTGTDLTGDYRLFDLCVEIPRS